MSIAYPHSSRAGTDGMDRDRLARLDRLRRLTRLLDTRWNIPGTRIGFGLDGVASIVPVAGDTLTALISLHIVNEARRLGVPNSLIARMLGNVALDWAGGSIPVLGTVFDIFYKANVRNLRLIEQHLEQETREMREINPRPQPRPGPNRR